MYSVVSVIDKSIAVRLKQGSIAICNDEQLTALLMQDPEAATDELIKAIKQAYCNQFNTDFPVTDASIAVEIWGHVFADRFANAVKEAVPFKMIDDFADKIMLNCDIINIGEKAHDHNRFFWDVLAPFKKSIAVWLAYK